MPTSPAHQPTDHDEVTSLSAEILALIGAITERFGSSENEGWGWIAQQSHNPLVVELLQDSTPTALRVLDAIGRMEPVNGVTISGQFRIPKGTVSKITRRLLAKDLIRTESLPNNKKEVLFCLTPLGRDVYRVHRAFDEQMERGFLRFLQRYEADELRLLVRILHDATEASFVTLGQQMPPQKDVEHESR
jgi:DNA-binding MarR family transcriptional regulator